MRRFLLHVLPTGIELIRQYGVLASACKGVKLAAARAAMQMPAANPLASQSPTCLNRRRACCAYIGQCV